MKRTRLKGMAAAGMAAAMAVLAPGCASVECSSPNDLADVTVKGVAGQAREHVVIDTAGYYLFGVIPLATGDVRWDERRRSIKGGTSLFRDHIGEAKLQNALVNLAKSRDCDLADVSYYADGETFANCDNCFLGALLYRSGMGVSATLVPRK